MLKKIKTNEGMEYQKLSPEEMKAKGILGRLVGVIADFKNPTRNGRKYSEKLWENVFNNPIMQEKIKNRCCFGELCHPEDRTEVDLSKVAICLAEQPKKTDDGKLVGLFDILDTPNGRILKALCDYGCNIGVSSRGQGDLVTDYNGNEAVDPDTYECECWDAVIIPAVESARLKYVTESLDTHTQKTLKQTLIESLNNASEEDKKIMEDTLKDLNIDLEEKEEVADDSYDEYKKEGLAFAQLIRDSFTEEQAKETFYNDYEFDKHSPDDEVEEAIFAALKEKLPASEAPVDEALTEAKEDEESVDEEATEEEKVEEEPVEEVAVEVSEEEVVEEEPKDINTVVDDLTVDEEEAIDAYEKATAEIEAMEVLEKDTVIGIINHIKEEEQEHIRELEDALAVAKGEKAPEEVEETEEVELTVQEPAEEEAQEETAEEVVEESKECIDESRADITEEANKGDESEEAGDAGDEELLNTLKEALKGKLTLERQVKDLHEQLAVSDAKVNEMNEEIDRYKKAVARLASMSKSNKDLTENVSKLEESLKEKDAVIEDQKTRIARLVKSRKESVSEALTLNESVETKNSELKSLNEELNNVKESNKNLTEMLASEKEKAEAAVKELTESVSKETTLKEAYKKLANKAVNKYIDMKATMLGLTSAEVKRKLGESYTLTDVDEVCEELKAVQLNVSRLPFNTDGRISVKVNESARKLPSSKKVEYDDDEIDDSLMKLANLK